MSDKVKASLFYIVVFTTLCLVSIGVVMDEVHDRQTGMDKVERYTDCVKDMLKQHGSVNKDYFDQVCKYYLK